MVVSDPGIDRGRADASVSEVVLDELEGTPGIEEMGGDGVTESMAGKPRRQSSRIPIP